MSKSTESRQEAIGNGQWVTGELPDSEETVLMRVHDDAYPIWPGFHDGEVWRTADSSEVSGPVIGWLRLEDAAAALDKGGRR